MYLIAVVYRIVGILSFLGLGGESLYSTKMRHYLDLLQTRLLLVVYRISGRILKFCCHPRTRLQTFSLLWKGDHLSKQIKSGDKIDPCGMPCVTFRGLDLLCPIFTYCFRSVRKL